MFADFLNGPKWIGSARLPRAPIRSAICLGLTLCLFLSWPSCSAQDSRAEQYRAKATFLAAFPHFVEWPASAFPSDHAPIFLCVYGQYSFGISLAEATNGSSFRGRHIELRLIRKDEGLHPCHILFVSQSEAKQYKRVLETVRGDNILTVGETPDFLASGGVIGFFTEDEKLRFDVNLEAANAAHLKISSNMLALARHVTTATETAKQ